MSATMTGDGWTTQHDVGKIEAWRACNDHGSRARYEVRGLFADVLDELRRRFAVAFSSVSEFRRAGAVVDIAAYVDEGGGRTMFEVKAMHVNPTCYRCCSAIGGRYRAAGPCACVRCVGAGCSDVEYRASKVNADVARKLRDLDRDIGGTPRGEVGLLQQRHIDLGGVTPLVMGAYGGVNRVWRTLLGKLAVKAAPARKDPMLCSSVGFCAGILRVNLQRRLCFAAARARYRLLHSRLEILQHPTASGGCDPYYRHREDARFAHCRSDSQSHGGRGGWRG